LALENAAKNDVAVVQVRGVLARDEELTRGREERRAGVRGE
jgi:hypothetical protein